MVETAELFWNRSKEWCSAMADKLTDIVYTDDSKETINVINLLLLGWILLGLVVYIIGNVIATYLRKKKSLVCSSSEPETPSSADDPGPCANDIPKSDIVLEAPAQTIIPTCEGDDEEFSKWINSVISWIYTQRVISPIIDSWLTALNARTRLSSTEHGILVDFRDLLPTSSAPKVTEVRQNAYSKYDSTGVTCDMEFEGISFAMVVTQFKEKERVLLPFVLQVRRLAGKVGVECSPEDVSFVAKYSEPPQIDLYPEVSNDTQVPEEDYGPLCDIVAEISNDALASAIVPLRLSCFPDCPRMHTTRHTPHCDKFEVAESGNESRLLVKVIKATQLGGAKGCMRPFCVVEMDDPPQRFETQVAEGTTSPFWDEGFTFSVKDPAELLFEIYDKDKATADGEGGFLGLGLVGVEELLRHPSQRQIIPLQSRPLQEDDVTGALTVEFLFLDRTSPVLETTRFGPPLKETAGKTVETNSRVTAGGTVITTTTIKRTQEECSAITPESTPNPKANPNANLHATEEMLHPKMPNASNELSSNGLVASSREETVLDQTLNDNKTVDPPESDPDILEPIVEMKLDSVTQTSVLFPNEAYQKNPSVQTVNSHAQIVDEIFESLVQESERYSDVHARQEVGPTENGNAKLELHAQIDDHDTDLIVSNKKLNSVDTKEQLENLDSQVSNEKLDQNGYHKQESDVSSEWVVLNGTELNNVSTEIAAPKGPEHTNGTQNGVVPKTVGITVPVIRPPWLPSILVEGSPPKDESANVEDLPPAGKSADEPPIEVEKSVDGENDLAGTALQQLGKQHPAPSKSTLIIHSVQRPDNSVSDSLETSPAHLSNNSSSPPPQEDPRQDEENRGRQKEKRSLMGTLRRRLSFHRGRSKSAETPLDQSRASSRSASTDRMRHPPSTPTSRMSPFKARFLGGQLLSPTAAGSTRSSLSEASGISAASAKTYVNENSTLVIETNENGIVKRYLIPNSLVHRSKWKKRGTKLHIYNDHVFVAKHLSGSTQCQVCRRHLTRRPGKQGYECRGCDLQCHKSCHVKVDNYCANSSINAMEVEYIHDPKGASPKSI